MCFNVSAQEDPTGTMQTIEAMNTAHFNEVQGIIANVELDFHPVYGTILPDEFPVSTAGITPDEAQAQLTGELLEAGYIISDLQMSEHTFTGRALVEHFIDNQQVFVWHEYEHVPIIIIEVIIIDQYGNCYKLRRVWIQTCSNGAGYWAWILDPIPCPPWVYTLDYYSEPELMIPFPTNHLPSPPPIDPTNTINTIHDLNVFHRDNIENIVNAAPLDFHPVYGHIAPDEFPMNPAGMTVGDAYRWLHEQTVGMTLIDVLVEERNFTGRALAEHLINGEQVLAWHQYNNVPTIYAKAVAQDGDGYCYIIIRIWIQTCTNGAGYWKTIKIRIPCDIFNITVDYSVEGGRIRAID